MIGYLRLPLSWIAHSDRVGIPLMRVAIAIVFLWIGALKFPPYEAHSITPFVANSPFISFFYEHPPVYKAHLTRSGATCAAPSGQASGKVGQQDPHCPGCVRAAAPNDPRLTEASHGKAAQALNVAAWLLLLLPGGGNLRRHGWLANAA